MKKILIIWSMIILLFITTACSTSEDLSEYIPEDEQQNVLLADDIPERKIIYKVNSQFDVTNLDESIQTLRNLIDLDEWFDQENIGSSQATFTIRVKTDRLDDFLNELNSNFQLRSFTKTSQDVSLQYQDKTNRIDSLNLQITRLQELYEDASLSDMLTINEQLSNLEIELMNLEGELNLFDSLVDYSEVNVTFYGSRIVTKSPFFNRLGNGFVNGLNAVFIVLDGIAVGLMNILPFVLILGPIGYGGFIVRKKYMHNKKTKKNKNDE